MPSDYPFKNEGDSCLLFGGGNGVCTDFQLCVPCINKNQCNDNINCTNDICNNPETLSAFCTNPNVASGSNCNQSPGPTNLGVCDAGNCLPCLVDNNCESFQKIQFLRQLILIRSKVHKELIYQQKPQFYATIYS